MCYRDKLEWAVGRIAKCATAEEREEAMATANMIRGRIQELLLGAADAPPDVCDLRCMRGGSAEECRRNPCTSANRLEANIEKVRAEGGAE